MSGPVSGPVTALEALRTTLAAEHAALYVHGALGGQTSESAEPVLHAAIAAAYAQHRARRDHLVAQVAAAGGDPVPAEAAYELPEDLTTPAAVAAHAREVEERCAAAYAFLVASTTGEPRRWAVTALTEAAVTAVGLTGAPQTLPGVDDPAAPAG